MRFMKGFILKRLLKGLGNHWKEVKSSQPSGFLVVDAVLPVQGSGGLGQKRPVEGARAPYPGVQD